MAVEKAVSATSLSTALQAVATSATETTPAVAATGISGSAVFYSATTGVPQPAIQSSQTASSAAASSASVDPEADLRVEMQRKAKEEVARRQEEARVQGTSVIIPQDLLLQSMGIRQIPIDVDDLPDKLEADRPEVDANVAGVGSRTRQSGQMEYAIGSELTPISTKSKPGPKLVPASVPMERIMPSKHPQPIPTPSRKKVSTPAPSSVEDIDEEDEAKKGKTPSKSTKPKHSEQSSSKSKSSKKPKGELQMRLSDCYSAPNAWRLCVRNRSTRKSSLFGNRFVLYRKKSLCDARSVRTRV